MAMFKQLKRSCILAAAATVLATSGCHSSTPTTQANAKSHQTLAQAPAAKPAQTAAAQPKPYSDYWDTMASQDQVTVEAQTPAPAETQKPVQSTNSQATQTQQNFSLPTYSPAAQPPTQTTAPQPVAQAPTPAPTPAPQPAVVTPPPAPQPVAQAPAPAPQAVAQASTPAPEQAATPAPAQSASYLDETNASESDNEITETERLERTQEINGARNEATLYPDQFDGPGLTSLGSRALDLMLQSSRSCNPLTLYLDIPDDNLAEERRMAIGRYLEDRGGLKPEQIEFHYGTNPANYHTADVQLGYYLVKTDTAADGYGASSAAGGTSH